MKLIKFSIICIVLQTLNLHASKETMKHALQRLLVDTLINARSSARSWGSTMLDAITNYGCWCYFDENVGKGHGKPLNKVDETCKNLHDGYTCISHDNGYQGCNPTDVIYASPATYINYSKMLKDEEDYISTIQEECKVLNFDDCQINTCVIETNFVIKMFHILVYGGPLDMSLKHDRRQDLKFIPAERCVYDAVIETVTNTKPSKAPSKKFIFEDETLNKALNRFVGGRMSNKETETFETYMFPTFHHITGKPRDDSICCGEYPNRSVYVQGKGKRCCNKTTFFVNLLECCPDGNTSAIGNC